MFGKSRIPIKEIVLPAYCRRVRTALYRRRGHQIADDVELAPGVVMIPRGTDWAWGRPGLGCVLRGKSIRIGRRAVIGGFCIFEGRDCDWG